MRTEAQMPVGIVNGERLVGEGVGFQRIRRITGYLTGTIDRFNDAKKAEVLDRVKHTGTMQAISTSCGCHDREAA